MVFSSAEGPGAACRGGPGVGFGGRGKECKGVAGEGANVALDNFFKQKEILL